MFVRGTEDMELMVFQFFSISLSSEGWHGGFIFTFWHPLSVPKCFFIILESLPPLCSYQNLWRKALFTEAVTASHGWPSLINVNFLPELMRQVRGSRLCVQPQQADMPGGCLTCPRPPATKGQHASVLHSTAVHFQLCSDALKKIFFLKLLSLDSENSSLEGNTFLICCSAKRKNS